MPLARGIRQTGDVSSSPYTAFPADGFTASWGAVEGDGAEHLTLRWENEAWTASVSIERERVELVVRLSPLWQVRQCLLFRDLDQPDLWLGTDGHGRWGEVNGAHRPELDGATDVALGRDGMAIAASLHVVPVRRLPIDLGGSFDCRALAIDVETLAVEPVLRTYRKLDDHRWEVAGDGTSIELTVDEYGLPLDVGPMFRRTA